MLNYKRKCRSSYIVVRDSLRIIYTKCLYSPHKSSHLKECDDAPLCLGGLLRPSFIAWCDTSAWESAAADSQISRLVFGSVGRTDGILAEMVPLSRSCRWLKIGPVQLWCQRCIIHNGSCWLINLWATVPEEGFNTVGCSIADVLL